MKIARKWTLILGLSGATSFGVNCLTDFRDSVIAGAMDYASGTTTGVLDILVPIVDVLSGAA